MCGFVLPWSLNCLIGAWWFNICSNSSLKSLNFYRVAWNAKKYEAELGSNILIFKTNITIYKTTLIIHTYIIKFSKHILAYTKHISILGTYILKFFKHIFTKHMLILRTNNNCFFKQVLIFPYEYYLRYRCYRTCQQELSCIKQKQAVVRNISYSKFHSTRWNEYNIRSATRWIVTSLDNSWCNLSVFLVFIVLPPANTQISIFEIIWREHGKKSVNNLLRQIIHMCQN